MTGCEARIAVNSTPTGFKDGDKVFTKLGHREGQIISNHIYNSQTYHTVRFQKSNSEQMFEEVDMRDFELEK